MEWRNVTVEWRNWGHGVEECDSRAEEFDSRVEESDSQVAELGVVEWRNEAAVWSILYFWATVVPTPVTSAPDRPSHSGSARHITFL